MSNVPLKLNQSSGLRNGRAWVSGRRAYRRRGLALSTVLHFEGDAQKEQEQQPL